MNSEHNNNSTLLIVDDEPDSLALVVETIEARGFRVVIAQNGKEALRSAPQIRPDLILLNVTHPDEDDLGVCRHFKSEIQTRDIPIILMTTDTSIEHKARCFTAGCIDIITKPLDFNEILSRVTTHLELAATRRDLETRNSQLEACRSNKQSSGTKDDLYRNTDAQLTLKRFALSQINEAVFLVDEAGQFHYVNQEACNRLGYSQEALLNLSLADIDPDWPIALREEDWLKHWTALRDLGGMTFESRHLSRSGEIFPVEITANYFEYGDNAYVLALVRDITERKQAKESLKQALAFTQGVIDAIPDILFEVDRHGRYLNVWTHRPDLLAAQREHLLGRTVDDVLDPQAAAVARSAIAEADAKGLSFGKVMKIEFPDGERWFEQSISRKHGGNPADPRYLVLSRDVTERIQTEAELRQHRDHLEELVTERTAALQSALEFTEGIINAIPDILFEVNRDGRYLNIWTHIPELLAAQRDELLGKTVHEALTPEAAAMVISALAEAEVSANATSFGKRVNIDLSTGPSWFELSVSRRPGGVPDEPRFLVLSRDISERIRAEAEIRKMNAELEQRVRERTAQLEVVNNELLASELEYRSLVENLPDNVIRYNLTGQTTYYNPNCRRILPKAINGRLGITPCEAFPGVDSIITYQAVLQRVIESGHPEQIEIEVPGPDGDIQIHQISFVAEQDINGAIFGALAIGRDVTALVVAERRLEKSHKRLRDLLARRESDLDNERRRIAREMHDELGQLLTVLKLRMSTFKLQFGDGHPALQKQVTGLLELTSRAIRTVRAVATSLRPPALDMGLAPALQWLVGEFEQHSKVSCQLTLPDSSYEINELHAMTVFRSIQEALTNANRHAEACLVEIVLKKLPDGTYLLEIRDDGKGFDPASVTTGHFGLIGMRERIDSLGGTMVIDSRPGAGTCIRIHIPDSGCTEGCEP